MYKMLSIQFFKINYIQTSKTECTCLATEIKMRSPSD